MSKLKPCPFCGSHPHHGLTKVQHDQLHGDPFQMFKIWCTRGHCKVVAADRERATTAWNTRTDRDAVLDSLEREITELRDMRKKDAENSLDAQDKRDCNMLVIGHNECLDAIRALKSSPSPRDARIAELEAALRGALDMLKRESVTLDGLGETTPLADILEARSGSHDVMARAAQALKGSAS